MTLSENKIDHVKAMVRLYEFCSIKKFHLIEKEFIQDDIGRLAIKINNDINNEKGINIFNAKDEKDLYEYENILNLYNLKYARNNFKYPIIGDDLEFLKRTNHVSVDRLKNYKIDIHIDFKNYIKENFNITIPSFNSYLNSPYSIDIFIPPDLENFIFIVNISIIHMNKKSVLALIMTPKTEIEVSLKKQNIIGGKGKPLDDLNIIGVYLFKSGNFIDLIDKPAKLFLKLLELYGIPISIGRERKKLFVGKYLDIEEFKSIQELENDISRQFDLYAKNHNICSILMAKKGQISQRITGFFIDYVKYINDYKKGLV